MTFFLQLFCNGVIQGALIACLAAGFGLVYRSFRIFHIAMGAQFVFSCYAFYFCSIEMKLPMTAAASGALLLSILFACLIEWIVYYPFYKKQASGGAVMIASLGVMIIVENIIALSFGNEVKTISNLLEPSIVWGGLRFTRIQLIHLFTGIALFCGVGVLLRYNRYFKAIWAMGDQPELIPILGLPLKRLRILIMVLGGIMIALPAMLISYDTGMNPHLGMSYLLLAAVAMFFGGADRYFAWGVGALILSILQSISIWKFSARWIELVTFGVLIFVLLFRPQGLFGTRKRLEEQS
ncbi:MAG: branched-chain amino acid ABC transporter permease [Bdellovibrionota bacterium]|jgi:branched-chain amino acid transport system permease protein